MFKINLLKKATSYDTAAGSHRITLEVISTENIPRHVFIKQRIRNFIINNFDDVFAAVATPAQLEDFDEDAPKDGSSYFRSASIDLVHRNPEYLEEVYHSILQELQKLANDIAALQNLRPDAIVTITASQYINSQFQQGGIVENAALFHTHYRLLLTAAPCGTNHIITIDGLNYHQVGSQDITKRGWLNTVSGDPSGYKFKYNIATDHSLNELWPPDSTKIGYAHLEVNGLTYSDVLITAEGIYWKENAEGDAPWPIDYVSPTNTSPSGETTRIVLDLIV
jgi:hypothetical protein